MLITILKFLGLAIGAYLLGGVLFAKVLSKTQKDDITSHDSGNPGSMNMLRTHGVLFGLCTFMLDALKGVASSLAGYFLFGGAGGGLIARVAIYFGGMFAVLGHMFPIYFRFKGGKGVATASGIAFVAHPIIGAILFGSYIVLLLVLRIGSLSSLIIALSYLVIDTVMLIMEQNFYGLAIVYFVVMLIVWAHRLNIKRLINKNENVVDLKAAAQKDVDRIKSNIEKHKHTSKVVEEREDSNQENSENNENV